MSFGDSTLSFGNYMWIFCFLGKSVISGGLFLLLPQGHLSLRGYIFIPIFTVFSILIIPCRIDFNLFPMHRIPSIFRLGFGFQFNQIPILTSWPSIQFRLISTRIIPFLHLPYFFMVVFLLFNLSAYRRVLRV